jgi:hypothetical protein
MYMYINGHLEFVCSRNVSFLLFSLNSVKKSLSNFFKKKTKIFSLTHFFYRFYSFKKQNILKYINKINLFIY